jgi:hypothetical protein
MQPGIYANAEEVNFDVSPGHPGLYVYGHSGCSTITGEFDVTDASFLPDDTVSSFSASFEQHCEGETPALFGTFTYNANPPTPIPEPAGYWLVGIGIVALVLRRFAPFVLTYFAARVSGNSNNTFTGTRSRRAI